MRKYMIMVGLALGLTGCSQSMTYDECRAILNTLKTGGDTVIVLANTHQCSEPVRLDQSEWLKRHQR